MTMPAMPTQATSSHSLAGRSETRERSGGGRGEKQTIGSPAINGASNEKNNKTSVEAKASLAVEKASPLLETKEGTLANAVFLKGCGVHSGRDVSVTLHPAEPGEGIVLRRTDLANGKRDIPLRYEHVEPRRLCTKVVNDAGTAVSMVEHLMCALAIAQIDNLLIMLDADELPILDGSAEPWLKAIFDAGVVRQKKPRRYLLLHKTIEAREDDRFCRLVPLAAETLDRFLSAAASSDLSEDMLSDLPPTMSVDFMIDFPNTAIGQQSLTFTPTSRGAWREQIASARTFAFKEDIERLRKQNFALGGSLDNAVLIDEHGIVNAEGLRYKDELVRHKILDLCGDLYLAGSPVLASVEAAKSGHRLNNRLLHSLFQDAQNWSEVLL